MDERGVMERRTTALREAGDPLDHRPGTLVDIFFDSLRRHRRTDAALHRLPDGSWAHLSQEMVAERVRHLALGLRSLGYQRGDRIGIVSQTRLEWALADWAMIMSGLVPVPVYPQLPPEQMAFVLRDAGAVAAFVSDGEQLGKLAEVRDELAALKRIFTFETAEAPAVALEILGLEDLSARGREAEEELGGEYESYARTARPDDLATLIYTSGTTGRPKGVMLTHDNLYSNVVLTSRRFPVQPGDRALSLLPLSHIFERTAGHYIMWHSGISIAYAESVETVARDMVEVKPTIMTAVPRVYDKVLERARATAREGGATKERIFQWARKIGERRAEILLAGETPGPWLGLRHAVADRLVFAKLRERTGGRIRFFVSGGGPLSPAVAKFFFAAGMPIIEGYGLTETSPVVCFNPHEAVRLGTVGPPIPGTEVRIAEDGEILVRGPQVMKGYFNDEEATAAAIDREGWFHTGDIGELDDDGYLSITDRKKEILVSAYGKNIAPAPIETAIQRSDLIGQAVLIGDGRKFPVALIVPDFEALSAWAAERGLESDGRDDLLARSEVQRRLEEEVFGRVAEFARYERPRAVLAVPDEFTVEGGELTATLKVKRRVVLERYSEEIDRTYGEAERRYAEANRESDAD